MTDGKQTPGDVIRGELERLGWTQSDLASVLGKHLPAVSEIIQGKRSITPDMAVSLSAALGKTPEFWATIDAEYRVSLVDPNPDVERRAKIFSFAPVKEMEKRGWIRSVDSLSSLEKELTAFFGVENLEQPPKIHANARQPLKTADLDPAQVAWCIRGARLASIVDAKTFHADKLNDALPEIRKLMDFPQKSRHVAKVLAEIGVRLVVVEPLSHAPIDGAALWLADDAPVILVSIRYDRIDCFWFTLAHELAHIVNKDSQSVDSDLVGESKSSDLEEIEQRANKMAAGMLIPQDQLSSFIVRVKPFYSKERIIQFAHRMRVHPGIVAGQLQFRGEIGWHANREMLSKVREHVVGAALTDGWGRTVPPLT